MRSNRAVTVVLLCVMLLGSGAWATACPEGDTGAGSAAGKPIVDLPKEAQKVKFRVTWEPADAAVQVWTAIDGHPADHGVKRGGSWGLDGIAKNSAGLDARALNHPKKLHCDMQVGWTHYEMYAATDKGEWSCFAHWGSANDPKALGPQR